MKESGIIRGILNICRCEISKEETDEKSRKSNAVIERVVQSWGPIYSGMER
jgi:hypothetical protein